MKFIIFLLTLFSLSAQADEVTMSMTSYHFRQHQYQDIGWKYNTNNIGLGYESDSGYIFGYYYNSYYKPSVYAGVVYRPIHYKNIDAGLMAMAVSGYEFNVPVAIAAEAKMQLTNDISLHMIVSPTVKKYSGFVGVALGMKF